MKITTIETTINNNTFLNDYLQNASIMHIANTFCVNYDMLSSYAKRAIKNEIYDDTKRNINAMHDYITRKCDKKLYAQIIENLNDETKRIAMLTKTTHKKIEYEQIDYTNNFDVNTLFTNIETSHKIIYKCVHKTISHIAFIENDNDNLTNNRIIVFSINHMINAKTKIVNA